MPLVILGVIFAVALGIYAFFASRAIAEEDERIESERQTKAAGKSDGDSGSASGDNVIFLSDDLEREKKRHRKRP